MARARISWNLGHGLGVLLAAVILITWPTTTAIRLVILVSGALVLLPWTVVRLRDLPRSPWWTWAPVVLGSCLLIWSLISALGSGAPWALSLYGWYGRDNGILMLLGVVVLLATGASLSRSEVRSALWCVVGAASAAALVSVFQALGVGLFSNPLDYEGASSLLGNPNFAAAFFSISALLSIGLVVTSESNGPRVAIGIAAALQLLAILLATSLQGPLALAIGVAAGAVLLGLSSGRPVLQRTTAIVAAVGAAAVTALVIAGLAGAGPVASLLRSDTLAIRMEYWKASLATTLGLPVFGSGPGGLSRYISEFRPESYIQALGPNIRVDNAHNVALQAGATLGLPGLVLWVSFFLSVSALLIWVAWTLRARVGLSALFLAATGGSWFAYLSQSMVSIDQVVLMALGWVIAGFIVSFARTPSPADPSKPSPSGGHGLPGSARPLRGALILSSVALGALGLALALPGYMAERTPEISSVEAARDTLSGPLTPCSTRLRVANELAPQVDVATYQDLVASAAAADARCPQITALYANVALVAGDLAEADRQSMLAVQLDPLDYQAWLIRAQVLNAEGDSAGAALAFHEGSRLAQLWPGSNKDFLEAVREEIGLE